LVFLIDGSKKFTLSLKPPQTQYCVFFNVNDLDGQDHKFLVDARFTGNAQMTMTVNLCDLI
jgi:hypothetical protein